MTIKFWLINTWKSWRIEDRTEYPFLWDEEINLKIWDK
jgi:hypothetical protein